MSSEKPVTREYVLQKLSNALSMPGINDSLEDINNFRWENEFIDQSSPEWLEHLFYLYTRPAMIEGAITVFGDEDWQSFAGQLLGMIMRKFPEQMLVPVGQMLDNPETRLIAICALNSYGEPDALPSLESLANRTGAMREEEMVDFIEAIESVSHRATDDAVKREAEDLLRRLGHAIPRDFAEAFRRLGVHAPQSEAR